MTDREPNLNGDAFVCPHCDAFAGMVWRQLLAPGGGWTQVSTAQCFVCSASTIWRVGDFDEDAVMLWPLSRLGPPPASDIPPDVAVIYNEARTVAASSPRSASALLRLALEALLTDLYPGAGNLNAMIGAAQKNGLPDRVVRTMDVLRFNGNQSVHELHSGDDAETARTLFGLLNIIVERLITEPRRLDALYDGLPEGVRDQINKRDAPKG